MIARLMTWLFGPNVPRTAMTFGGDPLAGMSRVAPVDLVSIRQVRSRDDGINTVALLLRISTGPRFSDQHMLVVHGRDEREARERMAAFVATAITTGDWRDENGRML